MKNDESEPLRKFDWFYFLALGILIVVLTAYIIYGSNEHRKLLHLEETTLLYLDKELCERVKFLESVSIEFQETHKKRTRNPKTVTLMTNLKRLYHND